VAICPAVAISNTRMDASGFNDMADPGITIDNFTSLTRNRRSIRRFKAEPVKKEHLDALLGCVRYIPTGSNKQGLEYHVVTDPRVLQNIKEFMAGKFKLTNKLAKMFRVFVSKAERVRLQQLVDTWNSGADTFLRNAPCLLVIHSPRNYFGITSWDAGIASHNIDLAAQTLGVATLLNGFYVTTCRIFKKLKTISGLPKSTHVLAAMLLGYPDVKYRRTVDRRPLKITYS
jgi:nitroreductase